MTYSLNLEQIKRVATALEELKEEVVFVGGSTTVLLIDAPDLGKARQTEDVDFIIDIAISTDMYKFEERMRELGFRHDTSPGAPICRWLIDFYGSDLKVDAMPANEDVIGFSNRWYQDALATATTVTLEGGLTIQVINPVFFFGTKLEAYKGRGQGEIFSHDLEDVFFVLEHRSDLEVEIHNAPNGIKKYLQAGFKELLEHPDLDNHLPGMLDNHESFHRIIARMEYIAFRS